MNGFGGGSGKLRRAVGVSKRICLLIAILIGLSCNVNAASQGDIVTVAGGGAGDGGLATSVGLNPSGVAADSAGNLYIIDSDNYRIRKVAAGTGVITTVAGNGTSGFSGDGELATSASLSIGSTSPSGVAVDSAGNLYIADAGNQRIRKVVASTGIITTLAGNGAWNYSGDGGAATLAGLRGPSGIAVDSAGNVYIADTFHDRVRMVAVDTGIITTVAGNGTATFAGDGGLATAASLYRPTGVALDSAGNLFIADNVNNRIRKVEAGTGIISTVVGNGTAAFAGDGGAAVSASLHYPDSVTIDSVGNLYISDSFNLRIRKVTANNGIISTVAGDATLIVIGGGYIIGDGFSATAVEFNQINGVAVDSTGSLYIADSGNSRIRKVTVGTGIISTVAGNGTNHSSGDGGPATSAQLDYPKGVALDNAGNLYIADFYYGHIRKVLASTGVISTVTSALLNNPSGVVLDSYGDIYIADTTNHRIFKVAANTGMTTIFAGNGSAAFAGDGGIATSASLKSPKGAIFDTVGNLYIVDYGNNRIRKVAAGTGIITTVAGDGTLAFAGDGSAATSASLKGPSGVAIDSTGNLYIADLGNNRIRKIEAGTGIISTVAGNGTAAFTGDNGPATSASLNVPNSVAIDSIGNLYISDSYNYRLRKVAVGTGIITTVAGVGAGLQPLGDGGPATSSRLSEPSDITFDNAGNLYIATGNRIRKVITPGLTQPTVITSTASSLTATSATLNSTVNDNYAATTVTIDYGLTTGYGSSVSGGAIAAGSGITTVSAAIAGLTCGTTYHFRIVGVNSVGTANGLDQTFTTTACPINGVCGSSDTGMFTAAPLTNLCSAGTATAVSGSGPWSWTCSGANGGSNSSLCSASIQTSIVTFATSGNGTISGSSSQTLNYNGSTSAVTAVPASGYYFVNWTGNYGFVTSSTNPLTVNNVISSNTITANFSAAPIVGVCGGSNNGSFGVAPTTSLCTSGNGSAVAGSGPWNWSCNGINGGMNASCGATRDISGPTLILSTLADGSSTNNATLNVSGTVSDANGVASVTINNAAVTVISGSFSFLVTLQAGANIITTIATDTLTNYTTDTRTINLDLSAPNLAVTAPADNSKTARSLANVAGTINETSTVTVKINNGSPQSAAITGNAYSADVNLASGINTITITATDLANNTASAVRTVTYDNSNPSLAIISPNQDISTALSSVIINGTVSDAITTATISMTADGQTYTPAVDLNGSFGQNISLPTDKTYAVVVTATDQAGNSSTAHRNIIKATPLSQPTIVDAVKVLQAVVGITPLTDSEKISYDVAPFSANGTPHGDGVIDAADVIAILRRSVGIGSW